MCVPSIPTTIAAGAGHLYLFYFFFFVVYYKINHTRTVRFFRHTRMVRTIHVWYNILIRYRTATSYETAIKNAQILQGGIPAPGIYFLLIYHY